MKSATLKKLREALNTGDEKGVIFAVALSLLVISVVVVGYYFVVHPPPEGYTTIYLLDSEGSAVDYPETLNVSQSTIFSVWVENHEGKTLSFEVQLKITNETLPLFPLDMSPTSTYVKTLENGENWEIQAAVTLHETGSHAIVFELWRDDTGDIEFTGNSFVLNVEAVNQP